MDNKEILKNAPEGATHISVDGAYILYRGAGIYEYKFDEDDEWQRVDCMLTTRKLSDIKRFVELEKENATLRGNNQPKHISTISQSEGLGVLFVLNAVTCAEKIVSGFHGGGKYGHDDFVLFDDDGEVLKGVTHWMPLPTSPSGGE